MTYLMPTEKQWLRDINLNTFTPSPPPQLDASKTKTSITSTMAKGKPIESLWGISIEPTGHSDTQALRLVYPALSAEERIIFVLDTVTHMHKRNMRPLLLHRLKIDEHLLHASIFHVPSDIVSTAGIIRTSHSELESLSTPRQWRELFGKIEPLHEAGQNLPDHVTSSVIDTTHKALILLPATESAPRLTHSSYTLPTCAEPVQLSLHAAETPKQLLIVLDGNRYLHSGFLADLKKTTFFATTAVLFLETATPSDRTQLFTQTEVLANFLRQQALPWVQKLIPLPDARHRIIAGGSLGGLAAAELCRYYPDLAHCATTQSASWWWNNLSPDVPEGSRLVDWKKAKTSADIDLFIEVGCYEGYLLSWNRAFREILREQGIQHTYREYTGGHDYACWSRGIIDSLDYFNR